MKTITLPTHSPHGPLLAHALPFIPLLLFCFALLPGAQAVGPDTEGAIPGSNNGEGVGVLVSRTTGIWNTGTGFEALNHLTAGNQNTATGLRALFSDTSGGFNTATGVYSLYTNTTGFFNSATGAYSLANNTTGSNNTANGYGALYFNTANQNTATGAGALFSNTVGAVNTATGAFALFSNTTGLENTANGASALLSNTEGNANTAVGNQALLNNSNGQRNTALGFAALVRNTTGSNNTALGLRAGFDVTTANNVICIGDSVFGANIDDSCYIGNIFDATAVLGTAVFVSSDNKLGTITSSKRFKQEITPMDKASEALFSLKPVTFRYKKEIDSSRTAQFGLVAEEVEKVNPDLVVRDKEGKPYSVRYDQVNAMLLNEFLKEHRKNEEQEATIARQQKQIEALTAGLQKVSMQLEASKPAPQVVNNP